MQIIIKTLDGQKKPFLVNPSDTVLQLKQMLAEKTGIYVEMIKLIFQGAPLPDDRTLAECHVVENSTVHMVMQFRSSSPALPVPALTPLGLVGAAAAVGVAAVLRRRRSLGS